MGPVGVAGWPLFYGVFMLKCIAQSDTIEGRDLPRMRNGCEVEVTREQYEANKDVLVFVSEVAEAVEEQKPARQKRAPKSK